MFSRFDFCRKDFPVDSSVRFTGRLNCTVLGNQIEVRFTKELRFLGDIKLTLFDDTLAMECDSFPKTRARRCTRRNDEMSLDRGLYYEVWAVEFRAKVCRQL